jgi:hypothetical protein
MFDLRKYRVMAIAMSLILLLSACGPSAAQDLVISTAVAQTVQAGESLTQIANVPTSTPQALPTELNTAQAVTPTSAPTLASAPADPSCVSAKLIGENPPDGAILKPGEYFWKTWTLQNTGTCTWDTSYKLIFWSGDLLGGLESYALPEPVAPNEQKDITIYLQAPFTEGNFAGYWRILTPWNASFGVGQYSQSMYVQIMTSNERRPGYGITGVTYNIVRDPPTGCPQFVWYTIYATISTNGPYEFTYYWQQIDDNNGPKEDVVFTKADSITVYRKWRARVGDNPNPQWMQIIVIAPEYIEYEKAVFQHNCPRP